MKCPRCRKRIPAATQYCPKCGAKIGEYSIVELPSTNHKVFKKLIITIISILIVILLVMGAMFIKNRFDFDYEKFFNKQVDEPKDDEEPDNTIIAETFTIQYELANMDSLSTDLAVNKIILSKSEVVIKGTKTNLSKIQKVVAIIDLQSTSLNKLGTYSLKNVKVVAQDKNNRELSDVEIVPNVIEAEIELKMPTKKVLSKVNIEMQNVPDGFNVTATYSSEVSIILTGPEELLDNINKDSIRAVIDLKDCQEGTYELPITIDNLDPLVQATINPPTVSVKLSQ